MDGLPLRFQRRRYSQRTPSSSYPLQGTQYVTNSDNYPLVDLGSSYPHVNGVKQPMPALETDSHGNKDYGIGFDAYFDEVHAQNFVTDTYGNFAGTYTSGDPFQDTVGPRQTVLGYHLARASTGANNIMETYLNDTVPMLAQNLVLLSSTAHDAVSGPADADTNLTSPTTDGYPKGRTLSLMVTDSDNVSAANTFGVTRHISYEENTCLGSIKTKHPIGTILEGIAPNQSHGTTFNKGGSLDLSGSIDGLAVLLKMYKPEAEIAVGLVEFLGKIATISKWEYEYADDQTVTVKNEDVIWKDAVWDQNLPYQGDANIPPSLIGNIANRNLCNLTVKRVEEDNDESWYADGYKINGFDGNTTHLVKSHKIDNVFDQYYFEPFTNSTGGQP